MPSAMSYWFRKIKRSCERKHYYVTSDTYLNKAGTKSKDYGKCGLFRHHKVMKNKHGQFTCKYCGKTCLELEKELKDKGNLR